LNQQTIKRFWQKIDIQSENGCWIWTNKKDRWGYGISRPKQKGKRLFLLAHRVAWRICFGEIPDGLLVCHHCDNPACGNPDHLFLGTNMDNFQDSLQKGRRKYAKGENHPRARLTAKQAAEIKSSTENRKLVAQKYGITPLYVNDIRAGRKWKHI